MQWKRLLKTATNNIGLIGVLTFVRSPAKYPLPKKGGRFCEENLLRYQNLPYVNPPSYHKLETFPLLMVVNQAEALRNGFLKNLPRKQNPLLIKN